MNKDIYKEFVPNGYFMNGVYIPPSTEVMLDVEINSDYKYPNSHWKYYGIDRLGLNLIKFKNNSSKEEITNECEFEITDYFQNNEFIKYNKPYKLYSNNNNSKYGIGEKQLKNTNIFKSNNIDYIKFEINFLDWLYNKMKYALPHIKLNNIKHAEPTVTINVRMSIDEFYRYFYLLYNNYIKLIEHTKILVTTYLYKEKFK